MISSKVRSFLTGSISTLAFWAVLFTFSATVRSLLVNWFAVASGFGDDSIAMSATGLLITGLGGTVVAAAANDLTGASFAAPLLLVPILLWAGTRSVAKKFTPSSQSRITSGLFTALGSAAAILFVSKLSDGLQTVAGSSINVTYVWILPVIVAALIGFIATPGAIDSTPLAALVSTAKTLVRSYRGLVGFLIFVTFAGMCYVAIRMGTGAAEPVGLEIWALIALALVIAIPSAAAVGLPLFLGASSVATQSIVESPVFTTGLIEDFEWVRWTQIGFAWLAVIIAAIRSANRGQVSKQLWWQHALLTSIAGAIVAWAASIRGVGQIDLPIWQGKVGFVFGADAVMTIALFGLAGLIFGLIGHPNFVSTNAILTGKIGKPISSLGRFLTNFFTLKGIAALDGIRTVYGQLAFVARKTIKYTIAFGLVGICFLSGAPLAAATSALYENEDSPRANLIAALQTGDPKKVENIFNTDGEPFVFLASSGLGEGAKISVSKDTESPKTTLSWADYSIKLHTRKSSTLPDFLGIIPQHEGVIEELDLPKAKLKFGDQQLTYVDINGKAVDINKLAILPGAVTLKAGVDRDGYLKSNSVTADLSKDAVVSISLSIADDKEELIAKAAQGYLSDGNECTGMKFTATKAARIGTKVSGQGLPNLVTSGAGKCNYHEYTGEIVPITFNYVATGTYSFESNAWSWTYKFN